MPAPRSSPPTDERAGDRPIGQIPEADRQGDGHLHEIDDQPGLSRDITKWAERIRSPEEAPNLVSQAARDVTTGRRGAGGAGTRP